MPIIVAPAPTVAIATGLCSIAEIKLQLNKTSTADDVELQTYIDSVTDYVEAYCGAVIPRTVTRLVFANGFTVVLPSARIVSVTSVTGYNGATAYTYAAAATPNLATQYSYIIDPSLNGILRCLGSGGYPVPFMSQLYVTYTEGFAVIPAAINLAARMIVQSLWETQRSARSLPTQGGQDLVTVQGFSEPIPARAFALLERYKRGPSVA